MKKIIDKTLEIVGTILCAITGALVFIFGISLTLEIFRWSEMAEIKEDWWMAGILTVIAFFTTPCILGIYFAFVDVICEKLLYAEEKPSE